MELTSNMQPPANLKPMVSVVLATYNESKSIDSCLASILTQQTYSPLVGEFEIEVLIVDGLSTDGTRAIADRCAATDSRVRVIDNPMRRAPFAFNLGLRHARGEYVCIFGAHTLYREDYIAVCLSELVRHNVAACGGRVMTMPANSSLSAHLAAWALRNRFGSSGKSFRTQCEGSVDTVNYAVFRRDLALAAGGYDEDLLRNQDNDLNQKLRSAGYELWCSWNTQCLYFPKATVGGLMSYGYGNGFWNAISLSKNPAAMGVRHFVPFLFVVALGLSLVIGLVGAAGALPHGLRGWMVFAPFAAIVCLHFAVGTAAAVQVAVSERAPGALLLPFVFFGFHVSYGTGTLRGFLTRPWTTWLPHKTAPSAGSTR